MKPKKCQNKTMNYWHKLSIETKWSRYQIDFDWKDSEKRDWEKCKIPLFFLYFAVLKTQSRWIFFNFLFLLLHFDTNQSILFERFTLLDFAAPNQVSDSKIHHPNCGMDGWMDRWSKPNILFNSNWFHRNEMDFLV